MAITTKSRFDIAQLRTLIQRVLTLPDGAVIPQFQPESKRKDVIVVGFLTQQEIGESRLDFDGEKEAIKSSLISTVSISCCGKNGLAMALKLKSIMQSTRFREGLKSIGGAILKMSDIRNLSAIIGAVAEERGQFDVSITHDHITEIPLEPIEQVDIVTNNFYQSHISKD